MRRHDSLPGMAAVRSRLSVELEAAAPEHGPRYHAIALRQCSRARYDGSALTTPELRALEAAGGSLGVRCILITDSRKEQVGEYVAAGNRAQFGDPFWAREMRKWIRFNAREAARTGDGLYGPVLGIPRVPRRLGELLMPLATSAERQTRKDVEAIRSSGAIAVLCSDAEDPAHWIEAGRCVERLALEATALGLQTAFMNQPVEVAGVRREFATFLGIGARRPDLVLRIGHGPSMPRSLRLPWSRSSRPAHDGRRDRPGSGDESGRARQFRVQRAARRSSRRLGPRTRALRPRW
jgi:hypothetical protein